MAPTIYEFPRWHYPKKQVDMYSICIEQFVITFDTTVVVALLPGTTLSCDICNSTACIKFALDSFPGLAANSSYISNDPTLKIHCTRSAVKINYADNSGISFNVRIERSLKPAVWDCVSSGPVSKNPCSWTGVTCDRNRPGVVTAFNVCGLQLRGTLPASLNLPPYLRTLDVSNNLMHGTLPPMLGLITTLAAVQVDSLLQRCKNTPETLIPGAIAAGCLLWFFLYSGVIISPACKICSATTRRIRPSSHCGFNFRV